MTQHYLNRPQKLVLELGLVVVDAEAAVVVEIIAVEAMVVEAAAAAIITRMKECQIKSNPSTIFTITVQNKKNETNYLLAREHISSKVGQYRTNTA